MVQIAWQTPKTDWKIQPIGSDGLYAGDWFNWQDYERIRENILFLSDAASEKGIFLTLKSMMPVDTAVINYPDFTGYIDGDVITDQMRYASPVLVDSQINAIERNLDVLADGILRPPGYPATKTWVAGQRRQTVEDTNRWERCCQIMFDVLESTQLIGKLIPFTLNGGALSGV